MSVHNSLDAFTHHRAQKPVPWPGAVPGQFKCNNETGTYQNIGVGRHSRLCIVDIFSPFISHRLLPGGPSGPDDQSNFERRHVRQLFSFIGFIH